MGTTAEKFDFAFDTKDLLKTEINKINNVLDDNSTFRSYPQELFNGYLDILNNGTDTLWNNLEKVSASGEEATLENVENAPIKMVLNGNTSQETTTGKNLFSSEMELGMINNTTGEPTASSQGIRTKDFIEVSPNTEYTISNDKDYHILIYEYDENQSFIQYVGNFVNPKTFTTSSTSKYIKLRSATSYGTETDITAKYQLEQGSTATSWEKYTGGQPSPSPDFPQQVKVVKGENVVSVSGKNLFDGILELGNINSTTGQKQANNNYIINTNPVPVEELTNYKISSNGEGIRMYVFEYRQDLTYNLTERKTVNADEYLTTNSGTRYISFRTIASNTNLQEPIQIEKGSTATDFVPYSKTDYPISLGNIELCKINTYKDFPFKAINGNEYYDTLTDEQKNALNYGSWYVHKEIGKKIFDGTETWNISGTNTADVYRMQTAEIKNYILPPTATSIPVYALCSRFIVKSADDTYKKTEGTSSSSVGNIHIYMNDYNTSTSVTDFKTWLSNNNVTLYYVLATPTETEITNSTLIEQLEEISKAKSVKDKTYITQTNDELPFILDVEAIKEYSVE